MNNKKPGKAKVITLSIIAIILLVLCINVAVSPIFYGSSYYHASFYEGEDFQGSMTFYPDNTMMVDNTNLGEEITMRYYYKDGYIFFIFAQTEAEYETEVAAINEDFEGAINTPFYASKINAFSITSEGIDGYTSVYLCQSSIMTLVMFGAIDLLLLGFIYVSVMRCKKV